jgi:hypothetical protein
MAMSFVSQHQIPTISLVSPNPVFLADGGSMSAGFIIKETMPLTLDVTGHLETLDFKVVRLTHLVMVGLQWFQHHNSTINWNPFLVSCLSQWCLNHFIKTSLKVDLFWLSVLHHRL